MAVWTEVLISVILKHEKSGLDVCVSLKFTLGLKSRGQGLRERELSVRVGHEGLPFMNGIIVLVKRLELIPALGRPTWAAQQNLNTEQTTKKTHLLEHCPS